MTVALVCVPSYQEMYGCFRLSACLADQFLCTGGIGIISISYGLFQIGFGQAPYHFRMGTFHIVCVKMYHVVFLCLISLAKVTKKTENQQVYAGWNNFFVSLQSLETFCEYMPVIEITSLDHPGVDVFSALTEAQLRNRLDPAKGVFIAESPKVIRVALDAGYEPLSLLCERRHLTGDAADILARVGDIPVYTR